MTNVCDDEFKVSSELEVTVELPESLLPESLRNCIERFNTWFGSKLDFSLGYKEERLRTHIYTEEHIYHISMTPSYLGCIMTCRKPEIGEDWSRGSDLPDGDFSQDTFNRIMKGIVSVEMLGNVAVINDGSGRKKLKTEEEGV